MRRTSRFQAWPRWKRALALAVPFAVLFALGELAGRALEHFAGYMPRRSAGYLQGNPYLRSALVPGARFQSGRFRVEVNSLGFRGPELAVPKAPGTFRIFALGESSTFGWKGTASHEGAWPALLEAKLREAHPGKRLEVVNAGVPGYTSIEQRLNFMLRISRLEPDALLVYHGNNDLNWSWVPNLETQLVYGRELVGAPSWFDRLIDHSYVLMELRSRLDLLGRGAREVRELAASSGVPLAEPARRVPGTSEYFIDWCHFSQRGEETMAQVWFETVQQAGWLTTPAPAE